MNGQDAKQRETLFDVDYKKVRKNYSIREDIVNDFAEYAKNNSINMSSKVESLIEDYLIKVGVRAPKKKA